MRITILLIVTLALGALALCAQQPAAPAGNPVIAESKQAYTQVKNNLIKMAEKMPEENYSFKPVPEIRSFGELMAHIADGQMRTCSGANGATKTVDAAQKKTKDEIVTALKTSFTECDAAWEGTTEANALSPVAGGRGTRSRVGTLTMMTITHNNEEYGYGSIYLRLKGIVPPSSEGGGMGGARGGR
jgi:hypothetical protein